MSDRCALGHAKVRISLLVKTVNIAQGSRSTSAKQMTPSSLSATVSAVTVLQNLSHYCSVE